MTHAATVRAGVERGDPLALRNLLTMQGQVSPRLGVLASYLPPSPARAVEPVAVDRGSLAAGEHGEHTLTAGKDSTAVEHPVILYPSDYIRTRGGGTWHYPDRDGSLVLPHGSTWTYAELDAEHTRQRRLASYQVER